MRFAPALFAALFVVVVGCQSEEEKARAREERRAAIKAEMKEELKAELAADAAKAEAERKAAEERAAAEAKAKAEEAARALAAKRKDVAKRPSKYLEVSGVSSFDPGFINSYRQVSEMTVHNKSEFFVENVQVTVEYFDGRGATLGSIPVATVGLIPPGQSVKFTARDRTLSSGKLAGAGQSMNAKVTAALVPDDVGHD